MYNQIIHPILKSWEGSVVETSLRINDLAVQEYHLIRKSKYCLNRLGDISNISIF